MSVENACFVLSQFKMCKTVAFVVIAVARHCPAVYHLSRVELERDLIVTWFEHNTKLLKGTQVAQQRRPWFMLIIRHPLYETMIHTWFSYTMEVPVYVFLFLFEAPFFELRANGLHKILQNITEMSEIIFAKQEKRKEDCPFNRKVSVV